MPELPATESMVARPVWARYQRRLVGLPPGTPTEEEIQDAIRVLEDESIAVWEPELHLEAFRIFDRASR